MKPESRSISLLRRANPARVEPAVTESQHAREVFQRIVEQPRVGTNRHQARGVLSGVRLRVRVAVGGAGIGAVAAALLFTLLPGSTVAPASAFAGWTARPESALMHGLATASRACGGLNDPVLSEARGPFTAAVYASTSGGTACLVGPGLSFVGSVGGARAPDNRFKPGQVGVTADTGTTGQGRGFIVLTGRVGSAVRAVVIHRRRGPDVTASISGGWFLAWWPAGAPATYATVTTNTGQHRLSLPTIATTKPSCPALPPKLAHGQAHAGCATISVGTNGPGSDGVPGPPMVGSLVGAPYRGTVLFNVYNATSVRVCFPPPTELQLALQPHGPTGPCTKATLPNRLPPHFPVQADILQMFPKGIWKVRLPPHTPSPTGLTLLVVPHSNWGYGLRTELTVNQ